MREILRSELSARGLSAYALEKLSGVPQPTTSRFLKGDQGDPRASTVRKWAEALGMTESELRGLTPRSRGASAGNAQQAPAIGVNKRVPVVGRAQLGDNGYWAELEYPTGHGDGYIQYPTRDPSAYALRCVGDSMRPRIKDGEFVIIEPNSTINPGDEVLVKARDGRVMVKTLLYTREGKVHLISINEAYPPQSILLRDVEKMHLVAAIVKKVLWLSD